MDEQNQNLEEQNSNVSNVEENNQVENNVPENNAEVPTSNESGNSNGGKKKNNTVLTITIFSVVIILILACCVFVALRENKGERFLRMCEDDYLLRIPKYAGNIMLKNNKVDFKLEIDADELIESLGGESSNTGKLSLRTSTLRNKDNFLTRLTVNSNETELAEAKILLDGAKIGVAVPGLFDQYVAGDLDDIDGLLKNLNVDEEEIKKFVETLGDDVETTLEAKHVVDRYAKIFAKNISNKINSEKNVTITINGQENKATKYFFKLENSDIMNLAIEALNKAREDKELYDLVNKQGSVDYTYEEWQESVDNLLDDIQSSMDELDLNEITMQMEVYRKGDDTLSVGFVLEEDGYEMINVAISALNDKNTSYFEVKTGTTGSYICFELDSEKSNNKLDTDLYLRLDTVDGNERIRLLNMVLENENVSKPELETIDSSALMLNTATQEERKAFVNKVQEKIPSYILRLSSKLPEGLADFLDELADLGYGTDNDYDDYEDYDYDYNYGIDDGYDYNYGLDDEEYSGDYSGEYLFEDEAE